MVNQQLTDYILQQTANGYSHDVIRDRLLESGWNAEEINEAFININQEAKPVYEAAPATETVKKDIIETPVQKTGSGIKPVEKRQMRSPNTLAILIVIAVMAGLLGLGTLFIYRTAKENIMGEKNTGQNVFNPSVETSEPVGKTINSQDKSLYTSINNDFHIQKPTDWVMDISSNSGILVSFKNRTPDGGEADRLTATIDVVREKIPNITLESYVSKSKDVLKSSFDNMIFIKQDYVSINNKPGYLLESTYDRGAYHLHILQLIAENNGMGYVVTATSLDSVWSKYKDLFRSTLLSFETI